MRYWYTYRTVVAVALGLALALLMYGLFLRPDTLNQHPEDRLFLPDQPNPNVVIVGIDDATIKAIGQYPLTRDKYAVALDNLAKAGASVVVFDIGFSEDRPGGGDQLFQKSIAGAGIPVVLAYGQADLRTAAGYPYMYPSGIDNIPIRTLRCLDANPDSTAPCTQPLKNLVLASVAVNRDQDAVVRTMPMFVEPTCHLNRKCDTATLNPVSFAAYRAFVLQGLTGPNLEYTPQGATFGTAWQKPLPVDPSGNAIINFFGRPNNYQDHGQYYSFGAVYQNAVPRQALDGKIVLVGAYGLTGFHDELPVPTSFGTAMAGVEIHANMIQVLLGQPAPKFLAPEPGWLVLLTLLVLGVGMGLLVARLSVVWGLAATLAALVGYTLAMVVVFQFGNLVPNLFYPWLGIALTYTGVTAYRFLYEDREKRKVTQIFGQYLKPEIVAKLAAARSIDELLLGGERRQLTLLFCDIRGFTTMSERMNAEDVVRIATEYLTDLCNLIFKWDGTIDKFVGDEIMAVWNAPRDQPQHQLSAVRAAYDMIAYGPTLNQKLLSMGLPPVRYGIGVNSGDGVWGNLGTKARRQFTALGDVVNTGARFCSNAKPFQLLIGQETYEACKDYIAVDLVPGLQLKGKSGDVRVYAVTAIRENPSASWVAFPTDLATQTTYQLTQQYTQQVLAAGATGLEVQAQPAAGQVAPTPPQGVPAGAVPGPEEPPRSPG